MGCGLNKKLFWIARRPVAHVCAGTNEVYFIILPEDTSRAFLLNLVPLTKNSVEDVTVSVAVKIRPRQSKLFSSTSFNKGWSTHSCLQTIWEVYWIQVEAFCVYASKFRICHTNFVSFSLFGISLRNHPVTNWLFGVFHHVLISCGKLYNELCHWIVKTAYFNVQVKSSWLWHRLVLSVDIQHFEGKFCLHLQSWRDRMTWDLYIYIYIYIYMKVTWVLIAQIHGIRKGDEGKFGTMETVDRIS